MHRLLERELRKATRGDGTVDLDQFLHALDRTLEESDNERRLKDRALEVMQAEIEAYDRRIREEAESRFNVVMENVGEAVIIIDERGRIDTFNKAAEGIFGYAADEVHGRNVSILMTGTEAHEHDDRLGRYLRSGESQNGVMGAGRELTACRKGGEEFPIELAVGEAADGPRRRFIGVIRDISQRKQAERALRESESRFRDLAGSASDWFWESDETHQLTFVSERIGAVLGVKPTAILGHSWFEIGLEDNVDAARHFRHETGHLRPFRDLIFHVGPSSGGKDAKCIRISGIPAFDAGKFIGYRGVGADITREVAAENRAKAAQQRLADAIESIVDGIAVYDAEDRLVICNREYRKVFAEMDAAIEPGTSFETVLRAAPQTFDTGSVDFETWARQRLDYHRRASGTPFTVRLADGRWILHREYRMVDGGVVGVRTDITEMKHREEELEGLRRRYQLILDSAGDGILGFDATARITFANRTAEVILGYQSEHMTGQDFYSLVQPYAANGHEYTADNSPVTAACVRGEHVQTSGEIFWVADGRRLPVDYLVAPIIDGEQVTGAVMVFRDATLRLQYERMQADAQRELEHLVTERTQALSQEVQERTRTEVALRVSQARLRGIADNLFEGVLVVDRNGGIIDINRSAVRLLEAGEVDTGHALNLDDLMILLADGAEVPFLQSPWLRVIELGDTIRDDDAVFQTQTGRRRAVAFACSPLREEGGVHAAIISFRDIEALKQAQREAVQANRLASVGQLAAGIAHEINTPTQYIGDNLRFIGESFSELEHVLGAARSLATRATLVNEMLGAVAQFEHIAATTDLPFLMEEIPNAVRQSLDGVAQVARIVRSMKEFSHPGTSSKTMTDINRALENTLTVCRNTWKHVAELECDFDLTLPPVPCYAGELNQVFLNLIVNATHAIEDSGKPLPGLIRIATAHENGVVVITIEDSGTGVPDKLKDKIFDIFFTTKEVGKGTGQGLAICRDVVVGKHGGKIEVGGREGTGACFTITLPIDASEGVLPMLRAG